LARARDQAAERDGEVTLLGGALVTRALAAGELDELTLHQVPVILGGGTPLFGADATGAVLTLCNVVPAPGVTHLSFRTMPAPSPVG
jgi:dihydrofolate reductase